ncbi:MAG: hypothetical protein R3E53_08855 [Myxococcota bacterium]
MPSRGKTGEAWVSGRMLGTFTRWASALQVGVFLGKNPWFSHGLPRARVTLRELARDPDRCLIVIDPRRTETAARGRASAGFTGRRCLAAGSDVRSARAEDRLADDWIEAHCDGLETVRPHFAALPIAEYCARAGVPESQVRAAARRIADARSVAFFEDLGVQMNRHSTLVSYLRRLLVYGTGTTAARAARIP